MDPYCLIGTNSHHIYHPILHKTYPMKTAERSLYESAISSDPPLNKEIAQAKANASPRRAAILLLPRPNVILIKKPRSAGILPACVAAHLPRLYGHAAISVNTIKPGVG